MELCEKLLTWKAGMEVKGLKMHTGKTKMKVMSGCCTTVLRTMRCLHEGGS